MKQFIRNSEIERRAEEVISLYERKLHITVKPPIPVEEIIMQVLSLTIDWDEFEEIEGVKILGGLHPEKKTIVLNIAQRELFDSTKGLERSTIGHEAGHWEYDVDKSALGNPGLFISQPTGLYLRTASKRYGPISVFRGNLLTSDNGSTFPKDRMFDSHEKRRVVNHFAAALNMPHYLIKEAIKQIDFFSWPVLYQLRNQFDVSITALKVRLEQLGYVYFDGKEFHRNKAEAFGQGTLDL